MSTAHAQTAKPPFAAAARAMPAGRRPPNGRSSTPRSAASSCRCARRSRPAAPRPDSAECAALFRGLKNPWYIGDDVALTQTSGWVDAWTSTPSAYAVPARDAADVAAAVNFARDAPAAAGGQGRRPQLPGHVERARFAAGLDAPDGSHRAARRLRGPGLQRRAAAGGIARRRRGLGAMPTPPSPRRAATCRAAAAPPWASPA